MYPHGILLLKCSSSIPGWRLCGQRRSARGQLGCHAAPSTPPSHQSLSPHTNTSTSRRPWHGSPFCLPPLSNPGTRTGSVSDRSARPVPERPLPSGRLPGRALSGGPLSRTIQSAHSLSDKEEAVPAGVVPGALRGRRTHCAETICLSIWRC